MTRITRLLLGTLAAGLIVTAAALENPALARQAPTSLGIASSTPASTFAHASGEGRLMMQKGTLVEHQQFEPRHGYAYAYGSGYGRKFRIILTAEPVSDLDWQRADVADLIRVWSQDKRAAFVMVELNDKFEPSLLVQSAGDGQFESKTVSTFNSGLRSIEVTFEINDGTRLRGRLAGGDGSCGGGYCDPQMDYAFDVTVIE